MKVTDEEIMDYLERWRNNEKWSDYNAFLDEGYDLLAADWIVGAGAIDPKTCYPEHRQIENAIIKLAKQYRKMSAQEQSAMLDAALEKYYVVECKKCRHVGFLESYNYELYKTDLNKCWECGSEKVIHTPWQEIKCK